MANPTLEPVYAGEFILSEGPRTRSRDQVTIGASQSIVAGQVLGYSSVGALAGAFAALGTNTGNPTCGAVTVAAGTPLGEYDVIMEDATHFVVMAPPSDDAAGQEIGHGAFGSAFSGGGVGFTISAGGTPCIDTDSFKVTVTQSGAADEYVAWNPSANDGSQNAAGISFGPVTTAAEQTVQAVAITRDAEVKAGMLNWGTGEGGQITAATAQLAALGIIVR